MEKIAKVAASSVRHSKQDHFDVLNSSKITLDSLTTALVERTFQDSAILSVKQAVADPVSSSEVDIVLEFNQLAISTPGGHYHQQISYHKPGTVINIVNLLHLKLITYFHTGTFGKFLVLLPVAGGFDGGILKVEQLNNHDFTHECHRYFYCCAFFAGCKYEWEPIKRGCMVVLDFDIVWRPSPTSVTSSISLPSFLAATKEIKEILSSWNYAPLEQTEEGEILTDDVAAKNLSSKCFVAGVPNASYNESSTDDDSEDDSEESQEDSEDNSEDDSDDDLEDDHILIVPLEETYHQTNFQFSALREKDRQIVHILQSIDFLDVHLATVIDSKANIPSRNFRPRNSNETSTFLPQIVQWLHSDSSVPQFKNYRLTCRELVGDLKSNWISDDDWKKRYPDTYAVIVIQPRHQSIRRCCDSQFDVALSYLESRLTSGANSETMRLHSLKCLGCVLQFCQEEPFKVWDVPEPKATERTLRLLNICHRLKAEEETRFFIEILGQDFKKPSTDNNNSNPQQFGVGVCNELVARAIVDLFWNMKQGNYVIAET